MINGQDLKGDTFPSMRGGDAIGLETIGIPFHYLGTHIGFTSTYTCIVQILAILSNALQNCPI